jgi:hypothetical protein
MDLNEMIEKNIVADPKILLEKKNKIKAIVVSHAHLDHVGAVQYMASLFNCPIYGTPFTIEVLKVLMEDNNQILVNYNISLKETDLPDVSDFNIISQEEYSDVFSFKIPEGGVPSMQLESKGGTYKAPVLEMKKLVDEGKASFVYIYYPGHGAGEMGTKSMYCAQEKGLFWQVHDLLMTDAGYKLMNETVKNDKTKLLGDSETFADKYKVIEKDIYYGYAITAHKSQASTYNTVIVDEPDFQKISNKWNFKYNKLESRVKEKNQIRYVSYTRAKDNLFLVYNEKKT